MNFTAKRVQSNFSRAADRYDANAFLQRQQVERILATALLKLPEKVTIADLGCGTGYFAELAKAQRPQWSVYGVDLAPAMLEKARPRCDKVFLADATRLPFADASFDAVVSSLCLQWIPDKASLFAEAARILKPGGLAFITTLGDQTLWELREAAQASNVVLGMLPMLSYAAYRTLAAQSPLQLLGCQRTSIRYAYASVEALMTSMRTIGAGNAGDKQFIAPRRFAQLIQQYEASHGTARGIPATWESILFLMKKA